MQFDAGDSGGDIQPSLALERDRLQFDCLGGATDKHIGPHTSPDRRLGAGAGIAARQRSGRLVGRRTRLAWSRLCRPPET